MRVKGFTLIELLIVVAIIGILAAIAVPNFMNARLRAQIARVEGDFQALSVALESYRLDQNFYPPVSNCGAAPPERHSEAWALLVLTTPVSYIPSLARDPFHPGDEIGQQLPGVHNYGLYWYMDRRTRAWGSCGEASASRFFLNDTHKWSTKSPGPNQKEDVNTVISSEARSFVYLLYDMSNGLHSDGDIYRFGP